MILFLDLWNFWYKVYLPIWRRIKFRYFLLQILKFHTYKTENKKKIHQTPTPQYPHPKVGLSFDSIRCHNYPLIISLNNTQIYSKLPMKTDCESLIPN